ncbi:MAG: hypothetical protein ACR2P0_19480 [Acidimicrobiales bacterium]
MSDMGDRWTGGWISLHTYDVTEILNEVQAANGSVAVTITGSGKSRFQNDDDTLNLELWKAEVDKFAGFDFSPWIDDGTIFALYLVDEPKSRSQWGGEIVHNEVIDEMARYAKQYWPTMPTTVRVQPTKLIRHAGGYDVPLANWEWRHLDTAWAQYAARKGPIEEYVAAEVAGAEDLGLGLVFSLQTLTGGDGSSGLRGPGKYDDKWSMSPAEIVEYGSAMIAEPTACALLMWKYDNGFVYFERPDVRAATDELGAQAAARPGPSCKPS